ncbi:hypothetical protein EPA93_17250 [Ktedonosporobacter rubrisoli]|uniref:Transmembrane protein n=1 Tax=Ktedonosporobacter rubrisoli TaxID=2509675 RepID=A0A4P6JQE7_KTERU|nr:hypothetical protein [Ktedonosporobacter rubrisoli]QBD77647.1 hypothetical protein EPA93_17250 [Ktedonosporobacter rubrisoli]
MSNSLEERLSAYYDPALPEQPLPSSSWMSLAKQLKPRQPDKRGLRWWLAESENVRDATPEYIREAFSHIPPDLYLRTRPGHLVHYRYKARMKLPEVRVALLGRTKLTLMLPGRSTSLPEPAALEVLLVGGLARYVCMRRPAYLFIRFLMLLSPVALLALSMLLLRARSVPLALSVALLIVFLSLSCGLVLWLLHLQARTMARQADMLMVQWIGRDRVCLGLHALLTRSRLPARRKWGQLSLVERINHICGMRIAADQERLTLVR